nr:MULTISPECIES: hypothetical protein [unclassified Spiroplasma]
MLFLNKTVNVSERNKLVAVCGQGLGSSLLIEINIKNIIEELKLDNIEVNHTNVNSFDSNDQKILAVICGSDLVDSVHYEPKIVLDNLLNKDELKSKLIKFLEDYE